MRLVAFVEAIDHVCTRYRVSAFRPAFAAAGVVVEPVALPASLLGRVRAYHAARSADAVLIQRKLLPAGEIAILRRFARKLLFDFDDAVWLRDSYSSKGFASSRRSRRFRAVVAASDLVIAGNSYLAAEAERYAPGRVAIVPTCVNTDAYPISTHSRPAGEIRLVWVGSASTLQGLDRFRDVLEAIGQGVPGARLRLICDRFLRFESLPVDPVPWASTTEAGLIAAADVGIAWVPDDPWSRGKCGLKVLQYQAAGLPVIANPVGVQAEFVTRKTGFPASSPEEWVDAVRLLATSPELRREIGAAGRKQVEERYSVTAGARRWLEILAELTISDRRLTG